MSSSASQTNASNTFTSSTGQPISLGTIGTLGLVHNTQRLPQNINILQNQLTPQQIAAIQQHQRASPQQQQHQLSNVRPVSLVGNQNISLQNVQVLGISQGGTPMQIRSIVPNAAAVVQANHNINNTHRVIPSRIPNAVGTPTSSNFSSPIANKTAHQSNAAASSSSSTNQILTKRKLQDLLNEIDPTETMDDDVEELLLQLADDFIENVINSSCRIAKHRKSTTLEVKDIQLHLDRNWNMWIPGFGSEDLRPYKKLPSTEAHRQRMALIKKAMKK